MKFREFRVLPEFREFFRFPYRGKLGTYLPKGT